VHVDGWHSLRIRVTAADMLNGQSWKAEKEWSFSLRRAMVKAGFKYPLIIKK
jgi:hypothetical protein